MREYLSETSKPLSRQLLTGLASAATLIGLTSACSSDKDPTLSTNSKVETAQSHTFYCAGPTQYIRFPEGSNEKPYLLLHIQKPSGEPYTQAETADIKDLENNFKASLAIENHSQTSRVYVRLPEDVAQLSVEVNAGDESTTCDTLLYPNKPRQTFSETSSLQ